MAKDDKWGIIDTLGNIVVPLEYDKIWAINEKYMFSIKAFVGEEKKVIDLSKYTSEFIFDGLKYIQTFSIDEFKKMFNCSFLQVKVNLKTNQLFFTYGCNVGFVAANDIPKSPVISIVTNSSGKIFLLLLDAKDVGKTHFQKVVCIAQGKTSMREHSKRTSFWSYEKERMNDADNWSDPYGDEQDYYGGWNREDVDNGLSDAYEGDLDARWNND